ncbi:MAG: hypothetical protein FWC91_12125 [Defluviitaleaceae bacterium]|nr:hypothetical protein [Defluviitaleaceae bacterium]
MIKIITKRIAAILLGFALLATGSATHVSAYAESNRQSEVSISNIIINETSEDGYASMQLEISTLVEIIETDCGRSFAIRERTFIGDIAPENMPPVTPFGNAFGYEEAIDLSEFTWCEELGLYYYGERPEHIHVRDIFPGERVEPRFGQNISVNVAPGQTVRSTRPYALRVNDGIEFIGLNTTDRLPINIGLWCTIQGRVVTIVPWNFNAISRELWISQNVPGMYHAALINPGNSTTLRVTGNYRAIYRS